MVFNDPDIPFKEHRAGSVGELADLMGAPLPADVVRDLVAEQARHVERMWDGVPRLRTIPPQTRPAT